MDNKTILKNQYLTIFDLFDKLTTEKERSILESFNCKFKGFSNIWELHALASKKWEQTKNPEYLDIKMQCNHKVAQLVDETDRKKIIKTICDEFAKNVKQYYLEQQSYTFSA